MKEEKPIDQLTGEDRAIFENIFKSHVSFFLSFFLCKILKISPPSFHKQQKIEKKSEVNYVIQLEEVTDKIFSIKEQLVDFAVQEKKRKETNQKILAILMKRCQRGEDVSGELERVKKEREEWEGKKRELQKGLERKMETEKLLIEIIQKRLEKQQREDREGEAR